MQLRVPDGDWPRRTPGFDVHSFILSSAIKNISMLRKFRQPLLSASLPQQLISKSAPAGDLEPSIPFLSKEGCQVCGQVGGLNCIWLYLLW